MDKNAISKEENNDLGIVIKNLIEFDAKERALVSASLDEREKARAELRDSRDKINAEYMKKAEEKLEKLRISENEKAEKAIKLEQAAAKKNIAEFEKAASEKSEFWVNEIYKRTIEG